jgi:hypothetical protein
MGNAFKNGTQFEGQTVTADMLISYLGSVADVLGYDATTFAAEQNEILINGAKNKASAAAAAYNGDRGNVTKYADYIAAKRELLQYYSPSSDNYASTVSDINNAASEFIKDSGNLLSSGAISVDDYQLRAGGSLDSASDDQQETLTDLYLRTLYNYEQKFRQAELNKTKNYGSYLKWLNGWIKRYENENLTTSVTYATLKGDASNVQATSATEGARTRVNDGAAALQAGISSVSSFYSLVADALGLADVKAVSAADVARFYSLVENNPELGASSAFISRNDLANTLQGLRATSLQVTSDAASGNVNLGEGIIADQNLIVSLADDYSIDTIGDRANITTGSYLEDLYLAGNGVEDEATADRNYLIGLQKLISSYESQGDLSQSQLDLLNSLRFEATTIENAIAGKFPTTGAEFVTISGEEINLNALYANAETARALQEGRAVQAFNNSTGKFVASDQPGAIVLRTGNGMVSQGENGQYYALTYRRVNGRNQLVAVAGDVIFVGPENPSYVYVRGGNGGDSILYSLDGRTVYFGEQAESVIASSGGLVGQQGGGFLFRNGSLNAGDAVAATDPITEYGEDGKIIAYISPSIQQNYPGYNTATENRGLQAARDRQAERAAQGFDFEGFVGEPNPTSDLFGAIFINPIAGIVRSLSTTIGLIPPAIGEFIDWTVNTTEEQQIENGGYTPGVDTTNTYYIGGSGADFRRSVSTTPTNTTYLGGSGPDLRGGGLSSESENNLLINTATVSTASTVNVGQVPNIRPVPGSTPPDVIVPDGRPRVL